MTMAGFSTLGCPGLALKDVLTLARKHSADLVQLRISPEEPVDTTLPAAERVRVREEFAAAGVDLGALATYVKLSDPDLLEPLAAHLRLAADLGAPALRLFPGVVALPVAAQRLAAAVEAAAGSGVRITVETHDAYLKGSQIAELLERSGGGAGAVWDVLHTWRGGETIAETFTALRPYLAELQIKDVASAQDRRPLVPGTGVLPLIQAVRTAVDGGFTGPVIFEHEARWYSDADDFDASLAAAMRIATQA